MHMNEQLVMGEDTNILGGWGGRSSQQLGRNGYAAGGDTHRWEKFGRWGGGGGGGGGDTYPKQSYTYV